MDVLIFLVVVLVILALAIWIVRLIPMDSPLRTAVLILLIAIAIIVILRRFGYV